MNATIVIILHNRHENIERLAEYYVGCKAAIILADSSSRKHSSEVLPPNWTHIYTPGISYTQKIETVLKKVTTRYVVLCADDDFIIPEALEQCVSFLDAHPAYAAVQGHCLCFRKKEIEEERQVRFYPIYSHTHYSYESDEALDRLDHLLADYKSFLYAVHRTEVLVAAYEGASTRIKNLYLNEYNASILPVIQGKYKELDFLYQVREYAEDSDDKTAVNINTIIREDRFQNDLNEFIHYLTEKIQADIPGADREILEHHLKLGLQKLAAHIDRQNNLKPTLKKRVGRLVGGIPFWGNKIVQASRKAELDNQMKQFVKSVSEYQQLDRIRELLQR